MRVLGKSPTRIFKKGRKMSAYNERLHRIWNNMKNRCYNPNFEKYSIYGAHGIKMCQSWKDNYIVFKAWALNNGYSDNLSIDRIDVNGNYCPENCRWATPHQQCTNQNRRKDNKTGFVGVCHSGNKFAAGIRINKRQIWLGYSFSSAEEACVARDRFIIDNNLLEYKTQIIKRN